MTKPFDRWTFFFSSYGTTYDQCTKSLAKFYTRILGANHQFRNTTHRCPSPFSNLIWQIIKGCPVSEGEQEKDGVHLLLTGLEETGNSDLTKHLVWWWQNTYFTFSLLMYENTLYFIRTGSKWSNLRKAFSPQSHSCRRKKSTLPLSLSFTGQYTTVVSIPWTKDKSDKYLCDLINLWTEEFFNCINLPCQCRAGTYL